MKLSDYVIKFLETKGIKHIFYLPGGGCMHLLDSMGKNKNIEHILMLHEQAVAIAAESYSMVDESIGVALVTTGPGGTNTVTGVAAAYIDSTPVFFISGQAKISDLKDKYNVRQMGNQEVGIIDIVKSVTKYSAIIKNKEEIRYHLERAWHEATTGRKGPVWLDIPLDIQGSEINENSLGGFTENSEEIKDKKEYHLDEIINLIKTSKRPVIIAGNGIRLSNSQKQMYELLEVLKIPVIPTWKAMDLISNDNPIYAGKCGTLGERAANFAIQNADLLISFGSRLDFSITGYNVDDFARNSKIVMVDIDQNEINKLTDIIDIAVNCDVKDFLDELLNRKIEINNLDYDDWINKITNWKEKYPVIQSKHYEKTCCTTYAVIDTLCNILDKNDVIIPCSAGTTAEIFFQAFTVKQGQKIRSNHGLGAMGFDIPASIGACIANSKKRVVCVCGDGGMQLNIQELATISGLKLPIKLFVVDNGGYASIRNMQKNHFEGRNVGNDSDSGLIIPDIDMIGKAYGIATVDIKSISEIEETVKYVLSKEGPVICRVVVDKDCFVEPKCSSKIMPDGSMKSMPLEDMYPFLSEKEMKESIL